MERQLRDVDPSDFTRVLKRLRGMMSVTPSPGKEVALLAQWACQEGRTQERGAMLDALAKDFVLSYPQVEQFCQGPGAAAEVLARLLHAVEGAGRFLSLRLLPAPVDCLRLLGRTRSLFALTPENPTGHYRLDLGNATDYSVAETLILLDAWETGATERPHPQKYGIIDLIYLDCCE